MPDQWVIAVPFVVGLVAIVLVLDRGIGAWLDMRRRRRDAYQRNHAHRR